MIPKASRGQLLAAAVTLALIASGASVAAVQRSDSAQDGRKSHSLFMGTDLSVELDGAFRRVREVSRNSWVVVVNARPELVPMGRGVVNLRVDKSLKLADTSATIANLKSERAYSVKADPRMKAVQSQVQEAAFATEQQMVTDMEVSRTQESIAWATRSGDQAALGKALERAETAISKQGQMTDLASRSAQTSREFHQGMADAELAEANFDAIEITFELAAERMLRNAYMIIVAEIRDRGAAEGMKRNWIYAQELEQVDETPRKIHLLRKGLPPGYALDGVAVHIYEDGREVATNVSPKRVELTREEAFQYVVIEHIGSNKGKTLPPSPAMVAGAPELNARLREGQGQQIYYVNVSRDGLVTEAFEDEHHSKTISDPLLTEALTRVWFKPALQNGKPVDGKATLDVAKLGL